MRLSKNRDNTKLWVKSGPIQTLTCASNSPTYQPKGDRHKTSSWKHMKPTLTKSYFELVCEAMLFSPQYHSTNHSRDRPYVFCIAHSASDDSGTGVEVLLQQCLRLWQVHRASNSLKEVSRGSPGSTTYPRGINGCVSANQRK